MSDVCQSLVQYLLPLAPINLEQVSLCKFSSYEFRLAGRLKIQGGHGMKQEEFPVSPLGKFGRVYFLDRQKYYFYKAYLIFIYTIIAALGFYEIVIPKYSNIKELSDNVFYSALLLVIAFGLYGAYNIASRGRLARADEIDSALQIIKHESLFTPPISNFSFLVVCLFSGAFSILLILGIIAGLYSGQSISPYAILLLIMSVYVCAHFFRKWRQRNE